jgi:hypothetical protein
MSCCLNYLKQDFWSFNLSYSYSCYTLHMVTQFNCRCNNGQPDILYFSFCTVTCCLGDGSLRHALF